ncbi:hypothetical protein CANMA_001838 [Candida margitis]|uniref:uncharacterized protein n=1 Tax=Candida margitis TaxID=1775924 RepID=UPI002227F43D|nr:uncharacterized protein CANMA_001838 [Candida margitis]KAI5969171.1 hypothetical protein CANMA_001838 [Candida margitis]
MAPKTGTAYKVNKSQVNILDGKHISAKKAASYLHSVRQQHQQQQHQQQHQPTKNPTSNISSTNGITSTPEPSWNPKHFRLFVGNLGPDANDDLLRGAFRKYSSMSNVHVPMDKQARKPRGYGFVAFANADDYLQAFKDMNGKYIGQYPVQLKRAESSVPKKHKNKSKR